MFKSSKWLFHAHPHKITKSGTLHLLSAESKGGSHLLGATSVTQGTKLLWHGSADKLPPFKVTDWESWQSKKAYTGYSALLLACDVNNLTYGKTKAQICLRSAKHLFENLYTQAGKVWIALGPVYSHAIVATSSIQAQAKQHFPLTTLEYDPCLPPTPITFSQFTIRLCLVLTAEGWSVTLSFLRRICSLESQSFLYH